MARCYDLKEKMFSVYGNFCSLSCAKGFLVQESGYDYGQKLINFARMASDVYGVDEVVAAPSRFALKKFGGCLDIDAFRKNVQTYTLHETPFLCNYMVIEESSRNKSTVTENWRQSIRGMRRPAEPVKIDHGESTRSVYDDFVDSKREGSEGCSKRVTKKTVLPNDGSLNQFMKD